MIVILHWLRFRRMGGSGVYVTFIVTENLDFLVDDLGDNLIAVT